MCVHVCEHPIVRCVHLEPLPQLVQAPSSLRWDWSLRQAMWQFPTAAGPKFTPKLFLRGRMAEQMKSVNRIAGGLFKRFGQTVFQPLGLPWKHLMTGKQKMC